MPKTYEGSDGAEGPLRVTFNQVQVVTAQDIEASGEVTVADYLRDLAVNSASSWADNFAYGATGGAVQTEILNLLSTFKSLHAMTVILVSHDMGVIAHMCDRAGAMGKGRIERMLDRTSSIDSN